MDVDSKPGKDPTHHDPALHELSKFITQRGTQIVIEFAPPKYSSNDSRPHNLHIWDGPRSDEIAEIKRPFEAIRALPDCKTSVICLVEDHHHIPSTILLPRRGLWDRSRPPADVAMSIFLQFAGDRLDSKEVSFAYQPGAALKPIR